jgi:glycopeptide antibiotics resistance protein
MTLDFDILSWFVGILILVVLLIILSRRKHNPSYLFCFSIFWVYLLVVLKETIFPIPLSGDMVEVMREETAFMSGVNLIPLYFGPFASTSIRAIFVSSILNVILTVPFGFGVSFIAQVRTRNFFWLAIIVGLGIESIQLVISLALRYPYRTIDVNDVLFNALGVLIGYGFFRFFAWLYLTMTQRFKIEHRGLPAYIYDVVSQARPTSNIKNA